MGRRRIPRRREPVRFPNVDRTWHPPASCARRESDRAPEAGHRRRPAHCSGRGPRSRIGAISPRPSGCMLLSFERPSAPVRGVRLFADLENCTTMPTVSGFVRWRQTGITGRRRELRELPEAPDHRQDRKGTWWMPWHQESKKGVNGCDKPRLGAE